MVYDATNYMDAPWDMMDERRKHHFQAAKDLLGHWRLLPLPPSNFIASEWPGPFDSEETANLCLIAHRLSS